MAPPPEHPFGGAPRSGRRDRGRQAREARAKLHELRHERPAPDGAPGAERRRSQPVGGARYGWAIGGLGVAILLAITIVTFLTKPKGAAGIEPGKKVPPFAVPLVSGHAHGAANTSLRYDERGYHEPPACRVRQAGALNVCELYERGPVVLALFTDNGSCPDVLKTMQALAPSFPGVSFVAVGVHNGRSELRALVARERLTLPIGYDEEGSLAGFYRLASCPQISLIERGGTMQSKALLVAPTEEQLRKRVKKLLAASPARAAR
ncbi:MAG: TlpA family protein disulfide reductase [Solirubrobacteraceae bacterium]